jgi:hypothetical protein
MCKGSRNNIKKIISRKEKKESSIGINPKLNWMLQELGESALCGANSQLV